MPRKDCSTLEVAQRLGLAVRSVQLMVDRGELVAWKTPGGHRRIERDSVERWLASRQTSAAAPLHPAEPVPAVAGLESQRAPVVLLIEDSNHFQNLIGLLVRQHFPQVDFRTADDGIAGLALTGQLQPDVLLVDLLLPGIDGGTLITGLRSHEAFKRMQLIVVTSLDEAARQPFALALDGIPVVHKPQLVTALPALLALALGAAQAQPQATPQPA